MVYVLWPTLWDMALDTDSQRQHSKISLMQRFVHNDRKRNQNTWIMKHDE